MKIGVLTLTNTHYQPVADVTHMVNIKYCAGHKYGWRNIFTNPSSWSETVWEKIPVMRDHLSDYDWLMWIDSDAMVMNHTVKIEDLIAKCGDRDLIVCQDYGTSGRPWGVTGINCGVFLIRNCDWSSDFLRRVDEQKPQFIGNRFPEQEAMEHVLIMNSHRMANLPHWLLNSFWTDWRSGDFVVHHAGGSVEDKVKGLTPFLEKVQYIT